MAKRGTRKCIICGKEYVYCPHCGNGSKEETWRYLYDSELCLNVFNVLSKYQFKHITKEEAKAEIEKLEIPKDVKFTGEVKKQVDEIVKTKKAPKEDAQIVKED